MTNEYNLHEAKWTDSEVQNFWDFQARHKPFENQWFTKMVGAGIANYVAKHVPIRGQVLDYGSGKGHLIEQLLTRTGTKVSAFDFSENCVTTVREKFQRHPRFIEAKCFNSENHSSNLTGFPTNYFDLVFLVETIEHLTNLHCSASLNEINRILKPGGKIVVTTPNDEDLDLNMTACPECGCVFHKMQHVQRFSSRSLALRMEQAGFQRVVCEALDFNSYQLYTWKTWAKKLACKVDRARKQPHLVYIGNKRS